MIKELLLPSRLRLVAISMKKKNEDADFDNPFQPQPPPHLLPASRTLPLYLQVDEFAHCAYRDPAVCDAQEFDKARGGKVERWSE